MKSLQYHFKIWTRINRIFIPSQSVSSHRKALSSSRSHKCRILTLVRLSVLNEVEATGTEELSRRKNPFPDLLITNKQMNKHILHVSDFSADGYCLR